MLVRQFIRAYLREWHENLQNVMAPGHGVEDPEYDDEDFWDKRSLSQNPMDPYGNSDESRGKRPKTLATSRAQAAGVGFGSGPMSGRNPGGTRQ